MTTDSLATLDFDNIFLESNDFKNAGKIKLASAGVAWKESVTGKVVTVKAEDLKRINWIRGAREYQLRFYTKKEQVYKFSNFSRNSFDELSAFVKENYNTTIEIKPVSLKGWNWGKTDFIDSSMEFSIDDKLAFEIPLNEVANAVVSSKNEVTVEFPPNDPSKKKLDSLVEIRFFIPNSSTAPMDVDETNRETEDEIDNAQLFCNTIKASSNIESAQGEILVSFPELPCIIPRGRFDVDLSVSHLRLRGKSYDYKILYSSITRLFLLPKSDEVHLFFIVGLEPPLRQGQTRYPYLVFQFQQDDEMELSLNLTEDEIKNKFGDRLKKDYNAPIYEVVSSVFKGIADKKLIGPGTFKSSAGKSSIKCSIKANEGALFPLEKSFMFLPKPTTLIPYSEVSLVSFSRVGSGSSSSKSFDIKVHCKNGVDYSFSNIIKDEFDNLEMFLSSKNIELEKESAEDRRSNRAAYDVEDDDEDDEDFEDGSDGSVDSVASDEDDEFEDDENDEE